MELLLGHSSVALERDQLIAVRDGKGAEVTCVDGTLWITQEQAAEDVVLEAGRSVTLEHTGLSLIMALAPARVRVTDALRPRPLDRVRAWVRSQRLSRSPTLA